MPFVVFSSSDSSGGRGRGRGDDGDFDFASQQGLSADVFLTRTYTHFSYACVPLVSLDTYSSALVRVVMIVITAHNILAQQPMVNCYFVMTKSGLTDDDDGGDGDDDAHHHNHQANNREMRRSKK